MEPSTQSAPPSVEENPCKEYWSFKRKRTREKQKLAKTSTKVPKLDEESAPSTTSKHAHTHGNKRWAHMDINEIQFFPPTIAIDLSFDGEMSQKVCNPVFSLLFNQYEPVTDFSAQFIAITQLGGTNSVFLLICGTYTAFYIPSLLS